MTNIPKFLQNAQDFCLPWITTTRIDSDGQAAKKRAVNLSDCLFLTLSQVFTWIASKKRPCYFRDRP